MSATASPVPGLGPLLILLALTVLPVLTFAYSRRDHRQGARMAMRHTRVPSRGSWLAESAPSASLPATPPAPARARVTGPAWLAPSFPADDRRRELYVVSAWPADRTAYEGVPTACLFLTARLEPPEGRPGYMTHVLRMTADPGSAVAVGTLSGRVPTAVAPQLSGMDFLLPAGWIDGVRLVGGHTVDGSGRVTRALTLAPTAVVLRLTGARHGIDGLPEEVEQAPAGPQVAYASLSARHADLVPVSPLRPRPEPGLRVAQIEVDGADLIDTAATAHALWPLTGVRSRIDEYARYAYVLSSPATVNVLVTMVMTEKAGRWRMRPAAPGTMLDQALKG